MTVQNKPPSKPTLYVDTDLFCPLNMESRFSKKFQIHNLKLFCFLQAAKQDFQIVFLSDDPAPETKKRLSKENLGLATQLDLKTKPECIISWEDINKPTSHILTNTSNLAKRRIINDRSLCVSGSHVFYGDTQSYNRWIKENNIKTKFKPYTKTIILHPESSPKSELHTVETFEEFSDRKITSIFNNKHVQGFLAHFPSNPIIEHDPSSSPRAFAENAIKSMVQQQIEAEYDRETNLPPQKDIKDALFRYFMDRAYMQDTNEEPSINGGYNLTDRLSTLVQHEISPPKPLS